MNKRPDSAVVERWWRSFLVLLAFAAICSVWQFVASQFGFKRYLVGAEFAVSVVCLALGWRLLATVLFLGSVLLEFALGAVSMLKLFDLQQLVTMGGFAVQANAQYLLMALAGLLLLGGLWCGLAHWMPSRPTPGLATVGAVLLLAQSGMSFADGNFWRPAVAPQERLLLGSAALYVSEQLEINRQVFELGRHDNVEYVTIKHPSAVQTVWPQGPVASKVLLVIAESWGQPLEPSWIRAQLEPLNQLLGEKLPLRDMSVGSVHALGVTAFAEFRELCGRLPTKLNLKEISRERVGDCLPSVLGDRGYRTTSVHGAAGSMYERQSWYPPLGFQTLLFSDQLTGKTQLRCHSFPGLCDRELTGAIRERFMADSPVFVYWLSLNSHIPYDARDLATEQPALCQVLNSHVSSDQLCHYHQLHRQFFEGLARLLSSPVMSGAEVLVVGDHAPPFNSTAARRAFASDRVPYVHIRVR
jgi:Sulfatase